MDSTTVRVAGLFLVCAGLVSGACEPGSRFDDAAAIPPPAGIINGAAETGWDGVGALTVLVGGSYGGSFCTATLIDEEWLLTAAHCVLGDSEFTPTPETTRFYVGDDARPTGSFGLPASGALHEVIEFHVHPDYADPPDPDHDLALVRLAAPLTGVPLTAVKIGRAHG